MRRTRLSELGGRGPVGSAIDTVGGDGVTIVVDVVVVVDVDAAPPCSGRGAYCNERDDVSAQTTSGI